MLAVVGHRLAIEQPTEDLGGFGEAGLADRWRVKSLTDGGVLGERVTCSYSDFEPASTEMVQAGQFLGKMDRVVEVIVQHKGAEADAGRTVGDRHERRQRRPPINDVIPSMNHVESGGLGGLGL